MGCDRKVASDSQEKLKMWQSSSGLRGGDVLLFLMLTLAWGQAEVREGEKSACSVVRTRQRVNKGLLWTRGQGQSQFCFSYWNIIVYNVVLISAVQRMNPSCVYIYPLLREPPSYSPVLPVWVSRALN